MHPRSITYATACEIRSIRRLKGWGRYRIQKHLAAKGVDVSESIINNIIMGKNYLTPKQGARSKLNSGIVKEIRSLSRMHRAEWISCHLESKHGIVLKAGSIEDIIKRKTWSEVP